MSDSPMIQRIREQALALELQAHDFRQNVVPPWYQELNSLDEGAVSARASEIATKWSESSKKRSKLESDMQTALAWQSPRHGGMMGGYGGGGMMMLGPGGMGPMRGPAGRGAANTATDEDKSKKPAQRDDAAAGKGDDKDAHNDAKKDADKPTNPYQMPEVKGAFAVWHQAEQDIGLRINIEKFQGKALLGAFYYHDPGLAVSRFVQRQGEQARRTIHSVHRLAAMCASPRGRSMLRVALEGMPKEDRGELGNRGLYLDDDQISQAVGIVKSHQERVEYNFLGAALRHLGHGEGWNEIANSKHARKHHKNLMDMAAATHDGRDSQGIPQERLQEMQKDARRIADEVDDLLYASDSKINNILAKYWTPRERTMFFRMLERENAIDPMLKRGDTDNIQSLLRRTAEFRNRKYNKSFDTSMTLGETAGYIGSEAARQAPGAVCHFAAGVFDGMSHIPAVGGIFKQSADGFRDLAKVADDATGASDVGRKWRNGIAYAAGAVDSVILQGGAAAEFAAVEGAGAAVTGARIAATGKDVHDIVEFILDMKDMYDDGKVMWNAASTAFTEIPNIVSAAIDGDPATALDSIDAVFDSLISSAGSIIEGKWTYKGKKAKLDQMDKRSTRAEHIDAALDFKMKLQKLGKGDPSSVSGADKVELMAAAGRLERAAVNRKAGKKGSATLAPGLSNTQKVELWISDKIKETLMTILIWILKKVKTALKDALKAKIKKAERIAAGGKPAAPSSDDSNLHDRIVKEVGGLAPEIASFATGLISDQLNKRIIAPAVTKMVKAKWPQLTGFDGAIERGTKQLFDYGMQQLNVNKMVEEPIRQLASDLASSFVISFGIAEPANQNKKPAADKPDEPKAG